MIGIDANRDQVAEPSHLVVNRSTKVKTRCRSVARARRAWTLRPYVPGGSSNLFR